MQYRAHQRTSPRHSSPWFTESIQGAVKVHYSLKNPTPVEALPPKPDVDTPLVQ